MRASTRRAWAAAVLALCLSGACASSRAPDQMKIGLWASRQDLWDEAIFRWRQVLETSPDSAAAHNNLAVAYEIKGLWDEARREYEAALKISPQDSRIKFNFDQFQKNMEDDASAPPESKKDDASKDPV